MILQATDKSDRCAGSSGAFDELYRSHEARIYRFCHRLSANSADAEDLAQEVFLAAFRGLPRFAGRASVTTWLYKIALNRWRTFKSRDRLRTEQLDESVPDQESSPDSSSASLERIALDQAMSRLPAIQREALLLVKGEGLTCREAAWALGIPEGTLKFRVYQAIEKLRAALDAPGPCSPAAREVRDDTK